MDNEWKDSLRERFSDYSVPEPEGLWEGIEQGMAGKPRRKMLPVWLLSGVAAAAAVTLAVFLHPEQTVRMPGVQTQDTRAESVLADAAPVDSVTTEPSVGEEVIQRVPVVSSRKSLLAVASPAESVPVSEDRVLDDRVPDTVHESVPIGESPVPEAEEVVPEDRTHGGNEPVQEKTGEAMTTPEEDLEKWDEPEEESVRKRFSISAYGHGGQASAEESEGFGLNHTGAYQTRSFSGDAPKDVGGMVRMLSANRASTFEARHSAPLRAGVTVTYGLTPHVSLVSGLNWTFLNSEFEESAGSIRTVTGQDLGYLGIPLRLEAGTGVWRGLWLYAGVGGMVEKGLMSSSWTHTRVDGQLAESKTNPAPDMGGLLWSVGATAGAEYRFSPSFGLYFSPGIEYHFDNGAAVRSAYTEKPLHWNMNLGVRFHLGK